VEVPVLGCSSLRGEDLFAKDVRVASVLGQFTRHMQAGPARYARFDPSFKPWFLRRNELVQNVAED
jgi:hypothetical protein